MDIRVLQIGYDETRSANDRLEFVADLVARQAGADLVVLPEMWLHGAWASSGWKETAISLDGPEIGLLAESARVANVNLHAGTFVESANAGEDTGFHGRGLWNTSVVLDRQGKRIASYRKIHRFGFGDGEAQVIEAGNEVITAELLDAHGLPLCTIGLATCYDLRFPELFRSLADKGADLFVVSAAWAAPRLPHWELLGVARAIENQAFVIQCNDGGDHAGLQMAGHSQVIDPWGETIASTQRGEATIRVHLDLTLVSSIRREFPALLDRRFRTAVLDGVRPDS